MIRDEVYIHNAAELEPDPRTGGIYVRRFPREVRHALEDRGRWISEEASGCELRFVTTAKTIRVSLCIPECDGEIFVYKGGLFHSQHRLQAGQFRTLQLEEPVRPNQTDRAQLLQSGFAPEVWRICLGRYTCVWGGVQAFGHPVRPPQADEMPQLRWLAYGSSITHGLYNHPMTYIHQAARHLGADVMNKALSGSCLIEKEAADFLAAADDWQIATLELGVNMRGRFTPEQFLERSAYLLDRIRARHPDKPLFLITIFPNFATFADNEVTETDLRYNDMLREHAHRLNDPQLHVIEGSRVLDDFSGLSVDLVHPSEYGHVRMGCNLAGLMKQALNNA
ncbi:GDSL-like Lipase/Acylhydrolase family protein [Paenibacillus sp. UNCCL117]|uniref:GDSL-type esterase/lipase family protein n=1 Tax=unclassified Paenibacillus TaxID=185978 RepID=UPI00089165BF|nr:MULTISPECIES: GDSL-type esterase/lipase family protein [unclassified Paenibacillus]SDC07578.1 GDSL-like Lipase/Acylhydrolase family protein [Paenibacillus sp. cl123]SFW38076.1 GDSL-like Lipase/Acylhydrolase family protein [Paenibacillus sp. UNCCL117]